MRRMLLIGFGIILLYAVNIFAYEPSSEYLGDTFVPYNVTVSSYYTTAIISTANAEKMGDWVITNNGSYSVYLSSYASADSSDTTVYELKSLQSVTLDGRMRAAVYAITVKAQAYTSKLDIILIRED